MANALALQELTLGMVIYICIYVYIYNHIYIYASSSWIIIGLVDFHDEYNLFVGHWYGDKMAAISQTTLSNFVEWKYSNFD